MLVLLTRGMRADEIVEIPDDDARRAEAEGWAFVLDGRDGNLVPLPFPRAPFEAADAYFGASVSRETSEPKRRRRA
jgi:hypothetical protein